MSGDGKQCAWGYTLLYPSPHTTPGGGKHKLNCLENRPRPTPGRRGSPGRVGWLVLHYGSQGGDRMSGDGNRCAWGYTLLYPSPHPTPGAVCSRCQLALRRPPTPARASRQAALGRLARAPLRKPRWRHDERRWQPILRVELYPAIPFATHNAGRRVLTCLTRVATSAHPRPGVEAGRPGSGGSCSTPEAKVATR